MSSSSCSPWPAEPPPSRHSWSLASKSFEAGTTISITVIGPPLHFYGVASSPSNAGLAPGFELGPVFTIIGSGQLDADGRAVFPFTIPGAPTPLYVQGATSPDPTFAVFTPTTAKTITSGGQMFTGVSVGGVADPEGAASCWTTCGTSAAASRFR